MSLTPLCILTESLSLNLTTDEKRGIQLALSENLFPARSVIHKNEDEDLLTLAHVGSTVYAVEDGHLHVFDLKADVNPMTQDSEALYRAYQEHLKDPDAMASDPHWILTMGDRARSRLLSWSVEEELVNAFDAAGVNKGALIQALARRDTQASWASDWTIYVKDRQTHHQHQVDQILSVIRNALPNGLLSRLERFGLGVGELAHWVTASGPEHIEYRIQAIEQQPYLLSRALMAGGQWPLPRERMSGKHGQPSVITKELRQQGMALAEAIDHGDSWAEQLLPILNNTDVSLISHWGDREHHRTGPNLGTLMLADVKFMAGRAPEQSFSWMLQDAGVNYSIQMATLIGLRELSANRRPKTRTAGLRLLRMVERTQDRVGLRGKGLDAFLKGLPTDLDDPVYTTLEQRYPMVQDVNKWMLQDQRGDVELLQTFRAMTWIQVNKFADRAHEIERKIREERGNDGLLLWTGCLRVNPSAMHGFSLHELCTEAELIAEGLRMSHCVGRYAIECGMGKTRIFSIHDACDKPVSTLAVEQKYGGIRVQQHYGPHNKMPPQEVRLAVEHWIASAGNLFKPDRWEVSEQAKLRKFHPENEALVRALWDEACRRYPAVNARYQAWVGHKNEEAAKVPFDDVADHGVGGRIRRVRQR